VVWELEGLDLVGVIQHIIAWLDWTGLDWRPGWVHDASFWHEAGGKSLYQRWHGLVGLCSRRAGMMICLAVDLST
jgi:hypothetical protein